MTDKERDFIFMQAEGIIKQYMPHTYSQPEYIIDIATEITEWVMKYIEDKCENCGGLL